MVIWTFKSILPIFAFNFISGAYCSEPLVIPFTKAFGPDGPWHGLEIQVGSDEQILYVYPAINTLCSVVLSESVCEGFNNIESCPALSGGLYKRQPDDFNGISWKN